MARPKARDGSIPTAAAPRDPFPDIPRGGPGCTVVWLAPGESQLIRTVTWIEERAYGNVQGQATIRFEPGKLYALPKIDGLHQMSGNNTPIMPPPDSHKRRENPKGVHFAQLKDGTPLTPEQLAKLSPERVLAQKALIKEWCWHARQAIDAQSGAGAYQGTEDAGARAKNGRGRRDPLGGIKAVVARYEAVVPSESRRPFPGYPTLDSQFLPPIPEGIEAAVCSGQPEGKGSCGEWFGTPERVKRHHVAVHQSRKPPKVVRDRDLTLGQSYVPNVPIIDEFQFDSRGNILAPEGPIEAR